MSTLARETRIALDPTRRTRQGTEPGRPQLARYDITPHSVERNWLGGSLRAGYEWAAAPQPVTYRPGWSVKADRQLQMLKRKGLR